MLERKGFLRRDPNRPRAVDVRLGSDGERPKAVRRAVAVTDDAPRGDAPVFVPVVGRIAAGGPILAEQMIEDVFPLPKTLVGDGTLFLLKVVGDSMIDAAISDGDWVVVRQQQTAENGDIVAAMIDGEATVKTCSGATGTSGCCRTTPPTRRSRRRGDHPRQGHRRPAQGLTDAQRRPRQSLRAGVRSVRESSLVGLGDRRGLARRLGLLGRHRRDGRLRSARVRPAAGVGALGLERGRRVAGRAPGVAASARFLSSSLMPLISVLKIRSERPSERAMSGSCF